MLSEEQRSEIERFVEQILSKTVERARIPSRQEWYTHGRILPTPPPLYGAEGYEPQGSRLEEYLQEPQPASPVTQTALPILVRIVARAVEVLGTSEKAIRWLNAPIRSLGDQTPITLLGSPEGVERVEEALGRIEHGVW